MIVNTTKTQLYVRKGVFLGFVISENGIEADQSKVAAIRDRPMPTTTTEICSFVNAAGYFCHVIKGYAELSGPILNLTGDFKNQSVKLHDEALDVWKCIEEAMTTMPAVQVLDWRKPIVIETDASQFYIGACLLLPHLHESNSVLHPVAYFSKKLTDTQSGCPAQER